MTHIHRTPIRQDYESLAVYILEGFEAHKHNSKSLRWFVAGIRNQIFDLAEVYTGYRSKESIETNRITPEHVFPRQKTAEYIVNLLLSGRKMTTARLTKLLMSRSRVHYVSKRENEVLIPWQKSRDYKWRKAYRHFKIELVHVPFDGTRKKKRSYNIDELFYELWKDVQDVYGISYNEIYRRCNSKSPKWQTWKFV